MLLENDFLIDNFLCLLLLSKNFRHSRFLPCSAWCNVPSAEKDCWCNCMFVKTAPRQLISNQLERKISWKCRIACTGFRIKHGSVSSELRPGWISLGSNRNSYNDRILNTLCFETVAKTLLFEDSS